MNKKSKNINRRSFLGQASCAAIGTSTLFSSLINLKAINAAAIGNSSVQMPYKAMICILQAGGNDSFNMLIPRGVDEYAEYAITRSNLAIPQNDILDINEINPDGQLYGVHPSMPEVQQLFSAGKLAFVTNIGTLIEPTTKAQFQSGIHPLPLGLFSHSDQIQQWQTGRPHERTALGWGGRVADIVQSMNMNENISMNVSLAGTNVFQQGENTVAYSVGPNGSVGIQGYGNSWAFDSLRTVAIDNMLDAQYQDIYKHTYVNTLKNSRDSSLEFEEVMNNTPDLLTEFSANPLSQSLQMISKVIKARDSFGFSRQIFFVNFGGWDHHDEVLLAQENMLGVLSKSLSELNEALEELGVGSDVTTFTISDFARTLTSNGNGTDHAWGGNVLAMGGDVIGGDIYGTFPSLALESPIDVGNGVLIPSTSADEYFAELALWFGVAPSELNVIFPNLINFYDTNSGVAPIGFLPI